MVPDLELKGESEKTPEVQVGKEIVPALPIREQKDFQAGFNHKFNACGTETLPIEQNSLSSVNEDVEVNITGCSNSGKSLVVEVSREDVTEYSSSFGDTRSGTDNECSSAFSDVEVESQINTGDASPPMHEDFFEQFPIRKKKLTNHWRRFIHPLMWRCKWIELQLKQLKSLELKYDKELAAYDHRKQHEYGNFNLDGSVTKSVPFSGSIGRNKVMMRKKRKRVEENCDLESYMSNHSLFSYYENKNPADVAHLKDGPGIRIGNAGTTEEELSLDEILSYLDYKDSDKCLKDIILKIEEVHAQVQRLKTRADTVTSENPGKFSSVNKLSMQGPSVGLNIYDRNPTSASARNKNTFPIRSGKTGFNMGDLLRHGSDVSSCVEMFPLIETNDNPQHEVLWEDTKDGILIHNQAAKEELHSFENVRNQLVKTTDDSVEEQKTISPDQVSEPDMGTENAPPTLQSSMRACSTSKSKIPRNKRRGKRRSS